MDLLIVGIVIITIGVGAITFREQLRGTMARLQSNMYGKLGDRIGSRLTSVMVALVGVFFILIGAVAVVSGLYRLFA